MCGRYSLTQPEEVADFLAPVLDEVALPAEAAPRYNIAPTQMVPIVANRPIRSIELARWGLVPSWADDLSIGNRLINARSETLSEKRAFRDAFARRRCLVPADGFYEWQQAGKRKQPYFIHLAERRPFALAGLWERWKGPDERWVVSFAIVTCAARPPLSRLHERMPVLIRPEDHERWLAREAAPAGALADLLEPSDRDGWTIEAVGEWVNRPDHDGPECIESRPIQGLLL